MPAGTLFCGQCGAPQIRVATSGQNEESGGAESTSPVDPALWHQEAALEASTKPRITWSTALPKAAIAGFLTVMLLLGLLSISQSAIFVFLALPLGGILSLLLYARGKDPAQIVMGTGVRIGAVTGLFSFLIYGIILAAQFTSQGASARETIRKAIEQAVARNPNPQAQAMMNQIMTPEGIATLITITLIIFLFVFLIFGAIGGSVGAAIIRKQNGRS